MSEAVSEEQLPPLWAAGGAPSVRAWESGRRAQLLERFATHVYGRTPSGGGLGGIALRRRSRQPEGERVEATLTLVGPRGSRELSLLLFLPPGAGPGTPVPAFVGLNFQGNQATEGGTEARRWPYPAILARGYAVATACYEELEVDRPGVAAQGVRGLFDDTRHEDAWGAIGAWAWGLSRALDALATFPEIEASAVVAIGHSRLGKTALWAAAQDERFAGVVSNDSGCGGASLFRHRGAEDVEVITSARPYWFAPRFRTYRGADGQLPVDQHQLLALVAPRLLHVGSATRDAVADPRGEFLATLHASPLFELYGHRGTLVPGTASPGSDVPATTTGAIPMPAPGTLTGGRLSYHLRDGDHDLLPEDWQHILDAVDTHLTR